MLNYIFKGELFSQNTQLVLTPKPSPYFSDWQNKRETALLIVNNTTTNTIEAKIKTQLFNGSGELIGETDLSKMPILSIISGISQFSAEDIYPISAISFYGKNKTAMISTGRIPDDNYRLCTQLINPTTGNALTSQAPQCKMFTIIAFQAPILISPQSEAKVTTSNLRGMLFRWSPATPAALFIVTYKLQVWEVLDGQDNVTALRSNLPIVEKNYRGVLQVQWPIDFLLPEAGKKYVWTITAIDDEERNLVEGFGVSEPFGFSVDSIKPQRRSMVVPSNLDTNNNNSSNASTVSLGNTILAGLNGEFKVLTTQIITNADGTLTGKGKVRINWLFTFVEVEFTKIKLDSNKKLKTGYITSVKNNNLSSTNTAFPMAFGQSWLSGPYVAGKVDGLIDYTNNKVDGIFNYINNNINLGQPIITYQSNIPPPPIPNNSLKMPFGIQFNNGSEKLVITEIIFKPNESKVNFLAQTQFNKSTSQYRLGFAGKYFIIHPNSINFLSGRVELVEDFTLPNVATNPKMKFKFKKGTNNAGCYVQWADTGITDISLALEVKFARNWLLPIPTSPDSVTVTLTGNATSMNDILLTGNLPNCEIVGTNGMKVQGNLMTLDLSDIRNPTNMAFPVNYPDSSGGVDWQGFYLKTFSLTMPDNWRTGNNPNAPSINATNFIIDDMGLTTKIVATNIITFPLGRVANLSASLDTVKISIVCNSIVNGNAIGLVILPISKDLNTQNGLKYTASFNQAAGANNFQMVIVPIQDIKADILKGTMTLSPTSNITAIKTTNSLVLSINLNGTYHWDNPDLQTQVNNLAASIPGAQALGIKGIKMEMGFENLRLVDSVKLSTNEHTFIFNKGEWSFASPQKRVANFPITITDIYYKSLTKVPSTVAGVKELVRGALMIKIVANLTEDIGGSTILGAAFSIDFAQNDLKFEPKFRGVFVDSLSVHADLAAVKINGYLKMFSSDPKFGDGFKASLDVTFTSVSLQLKALAQFGSTFHNNNQFYRYWRVEADVKLPVGVPFLTGVGFYGFGGGAFYNMEAIIKISVANPGSNTYTFEPKKSSLGFIVKATIATMPKFETFNTDVSLLAQFSNSDGITGIGFTGDFWLAAKLAERNLAKIKGTVLVNYNFPDKLFNMAAGLNINVPNVITTAPGGIGFAMKIDGRANLWYFKCGIPAAPNSVKVFTYPFIFLFNVW